MTAQSVKVAVVQRPPVLLDRDSTLKAAVEAVSEVADAGAGLVVFPETYLPGYPAWIWSLRPGDDYRPQPGHPRPAAGQQCRPVHR